MKQKSSVGLLLTVFAFCGMLTCVAGCEDKGNENKADKSSYKVPESSMQKAYGGGDPAKAAAGGAGGAAPAQGGAAPAPAGQ